jgi:hypothetical protein
MRKVRKTVALRAVIWAAGVVPTHCATTLEDAVLQGAAQVVTETTAGVLFSLLGFGFDGPGAGGGGLNGGSDPFAGPPVQT